jgi:hypothetical protein
MAVIARCAKRAVAIRLDAHVASLLGMTFGWVHPH